MNEMTFFLVLECWSGPNDFIHHFSGYEDDERHFTPQNGYNNMEEEDGGAGGDMEVEEEGGKQERSVSSNCCCCCCCCCYGLVAIVVAAAAVVCCCYGLVAVGAAAVSIAHAANAVIVVLFLSELTFPIFSLIRGRKREKKGGGGGLSNLGAKIRKARLPSPGQVVSGYVSSDFHQKNFVQPLVSRSRKEDQDVARQRQKMVEGRTVGELAKVSGPFDIPLPKWKGHNRGKSEERARNKDNEQEGDK